LVLGVFTGNCYFCKEQGHKATACPSKTNSGGDHKAYNKSSANKKKLMGICNNCGKFGHKKSDYWEMEANNCKRPNNCRGSTDQVAAAVATNEDEVEYVLCGVKEINDTDKFELVDTEVSLYSMHFGDIYDDIIMSDELCEDDVGDEKIVMATVNFPGNMNMLSNPNI
jgi:hypothetical protein